MTRSLHWFNHRCTRDGVEGSNSNALCPDITVHDDDGYALFPPPIVNVMVISWHGSAARREALGSVLLAQWIKMKPEFRTIILE